MLSKLAQLGLLAIENVRLSPSTSLADGVKSKVVSSSTVLLGEPEIVGASFTLSMVMLTVTSSESNSVSLATKVKLSEPLKSVLPL